jgi:hypothetical protein
MLIYGYYKGEFVIGVCTENTRCIKISAVLISEMQTHSSMCHESVPIIQNNNNKVEYYSN